MARVFRRKDKTSGHWETPDGAKIFFRKATQTEMEEQKNKAPTYHAWVVARLFLNSDEEQPIMDHRGNKVGLLTEDGRLQVELGAEELASNCRFLADKITKISGFEDEDGEPLRWDDLEEEERVEFIDVLNQTEMTELYWSVVVGMGIKDQVKLLEETNQKMKEKLEEEE